MNPSGEQTDYSRPVAYDEHGRPLYAHPPAIATTVQPLSQSISAQPEPVMESQVPVAQAANLPLSTKNPSAKQPYIASIDSETRKLHNQSITKYPLLSLSEGEYVITTLRRHPIGMISIWGIVALSILITLFLPAMYYGLGIDATLRLSATATIALGLTLLVIIVLSIAAGMIATYVYESNRFYLTNENVTQRIQASLFSKKIQTINLGSIEDVSYRRSGIIQTVLNYGSIRLSTEGEETTYRFSYVSDPEKQVHMINDAMEAFRKTHLNDNNGS